MPHNFHSSARISPLSDIEDSTKGSLIEIGENSVIDSFVKVRAAGGVGNISIGRNVVINSGCVLYIGNGITIGHNSMIAANVTFAPSNHSFSDPKSLISTQGFQQSKGGIVIGEDVWIGAGCVILDGAIIGSGSIIGAMSLINSTIEPYSIGFGVPFQTRALRN
jgi:virginiamycin A acetyltransferase